MAVSLPIESNPETMSRYLHKLGVSDKWRLVDVVGLENDALEWVPKPVLAVILLFPLSDAYEEHRSAQETELQKEAQGTSTDVFHLKQVLSNACGTIALVHSVANNTLHIDINDDGLLKKYLDDAKDLDSAAKGALLEKSTDILQAYREIISAGAGQEQEEEHVNNHFVTFIHKDGMLFELDGRKSFPISHGPTNTETFLVDAAKICREFIAREPDNIGFNIVALVPSEQK